MGMEGGEQYLPPLLGADVVVQVGDEQFYRTHKVVPLHRILLTGGAARRARTVTPNRLESIHVWRASVRQMAGCIVRLLRALAIWCVVVIGALSLHGVLRHHARLTITTIPSIQAVRVRPIICILVAV